MPHKRDARVVLDVRTIMGAASAWCNPLETSAKNSQRLHALEHAAAGAAICFSQESHTYLQDVIVQRVKRLSYKGEGTDWVDRYARFLDLYIEPRKQIWADSFAPRFEERLPADLAISLRAAFSAGADYLVTRCPRDWMKDVYNVQKVCHPRWFPARALEKMPTRLRPREAGRLLFAAADFPRSEAGIQPARLAPEP